MKNQLASLFSLTALALLAGASHAQTTVYSNLTTDQGVDFQQHPSGSIGGAFNATRLLLDDITPIAGHAGEWITEVSFTVSNGNAFSLSPGYSLYFFDASGVGGTPVNAIYGVSLVPSVVPSGVSTITVPLTPGTLALPSGTFWAGIAFNSNTIPTSQLDQLGQELFGLPTVGTSGDRIFLSDNPFNGGPMTGTTLTSSPGNPAMSLGWQIRTTASSGAAPEPATVALLLGGTLVLVRRRRFA